MDPVLLARIQFALTVGFHFIFPPITIGLAWILVVLETVGWRTQNPVYVKTAKFFGELLAITFAVGVATGITMEFQFGTNWAQYAKFVGDIFGAPLAAEAVIAFFLESTFIGLYLFGRNRVSRGVHWFSCLMVAVGSTLSAFWILVANSWQQTPAGFVLRNQRAELTDFAAAVFNPSTLPRFLHTMDAALITGAFFTAGIAAYLLLKKRDSQTGRAALSVALITAALFSLLALFHSGHAHAKQVLATQPAKFAALEGVNETTDDAPLVLLGLPGAEPKRIRPLLTLPHITGWLANGFTKKPIAGLSSFKNEDLPPVFLPFAAYHIMIGLGCLFIGVSVLGVWLLATRRLWKATWFLFLLVPTIPLPVINCQLGWIAAEVGRQPWIVYNLLRTRDAISLSVPAGQILFSLLLFGSLYFVLGCLYVFLIAKRVQTQVARELKEVA
ncbi:MAG: cytochrome ubiquinol oxidase subunit I [Candidatus Firestonebacteria bacterium]|nr:cytochrome ubiquinol oxidase subunit I [Candidatus Firestonebacteria bacterium]